MLNHIHIFGASGSGTTTLASALATKHGHTHLDTDNFYWIATDPPFREKRPIDQRLHLLREARNTSNIKADCVPVVDGTKLIVR